MTLTFLIRSFIASFRVICYTWEFAHIEAGLQILMLLHVEEASVYSIVIITISATVIYCPSLNWLVLFYVNV